MANENLSAGQAVVEKRPNVSRDKFIEIWESCSSAAEAAEKLGTTPQTASSTASKYRSPEGGGFPLKVMPKGGGVRLNPETTFELIAKLRGKSVAEIKAESEKMLAAKAAKDAEKAAS